MTGKSTGPQTGHRDLARPARDLTFGERSVSLPTAGGTDVVTGRHSFDPSFLHGRSCARALAALLLDTSRPSGLTPSRADEAKTYVRRLSAPASASTRRPDDVGESALDSRVDFRYGSALQGFAARRSPRAASPPFARIPTSRSSPPIGVFTP